MPQPASGRATPLLKGCLCFLTFAMATNGAADDLAAKIKVTFALIWRGVGVHPLSHKLKHAKSVCILYPRKHAKDTTALNPKPLNPKP